MKMYKNTVDRIDKNRSGFGCLRNSMPRQAKMRILTQNEY